MSDLKDVDVLKVARHMYDRNSEQLGATDAERDQYWGDSEIRKFWAEEAASVLSFVGFAQVDHSSDRPTSGSEERAPRGPQ